MECRRNGLTQARLGREQSTSLDDQRYRETDGPDDTATTCPRTAANSDPHPLKLVVTQGTVSP